MSASSDVRDILRRHAVGTQAELTVEATTAAMVIRAASRAGYRPSESHLRALRRMLKRIDQVATYQDEGLLPEFVSEERVTRESLELVQVMARASHREDDPHPGHEGDSNVYEFPVLETLVDSRNAIAVDGSTITVVDATKAVGLADGLEKLAGEVLSEAIAEDRTRTSSYAVI